MTKKRCAWCEGDDLYIKYHDEEWGKVSHDDHHLFEKINLEGAQAGLSWITILRKREGYRKAFDNFDASKIIKYDDKKIEELVNNPDIIRNRLKIKAVISNAKTYLEIKKEFGSFDKYIWHFTDNKTLTRADHIEAVKVSEQMSKDLKKRGFKFIGPTICYSFMQSVGIMNDHAPDCFRRTQV
jgi:DNA-3-methyladenine glycosylase I